MLREDVVEAVKEGKFHIYPISAIDEGIGLPTGIEAGEQNAQDEYPVHTLNFAVQTRVKVMADKVRSFFENAGEANLQLERR